MYVLVIHHKLNCCVVSRTSSLLLIPKCTSLLIIDISDTNWCIYLYFGFCKTNCRYVWSNWFWGNSPAGKLLFSPSSWKNNSLWLCWSDRYPFCWTHQCCFAFLSYFLLSTVVCTTNLMNCGKVWNKSRVQVVFGGYLSCSCCTCFGQWMRHLEKTSKRHVLE